MLRLLMLSAVSAVGFAGAASALNVDFETFGGSEGTVANPFSFGGATFTSTEDITMVKVGGASPAGFVPTDTPDPSTAFGDWFIAGDFNKNTNLSFTFGKDLTDISFDIADIDGGSGGNQEKFVFDFRLGGSSVSTQTVKAGDTGTGDAKVTSISYSGLFDTVSISGTTPDGTRNIGWGLDNISATAVPLPAGIWLLLSVFGGLGLIRRFNRAA